MALRKEGIDALERIMLHNAERYRQNTFGELDANCGTVMCAAGFARLLAVGEAAYRAEVATMDFLALCNICEASGASLLGVEGYGADSLTPQLFENERWWPRDLREAFAALAGDHLGQIKFYIAMLRERVNDDGSIREVSR